MSMHSWKDVVTLVISNSSLAFARELLHVGMSPLSRFGLWAAVVQSVLSSVFNREEDVVNSDRQARELMGKVLDLTH